MDALHRLIAEHYVDTFGIPLEAAIELVTEPPVRADAGGWLSGPCIDPAGEGE